MSEIDQARTALELLERIEEALDSLYLDDWHRRRVNDAMDTIRINIERELGILERDRLTQLCGTTWADEARWLRMAGILK